MERIDEPTTFEAQEVTTIAPVAKISLNPDSRIVMVGTDKGVKEIHLEGLDFDVLYFLGRHVCQAIPVERIDKVISDNQETDRYMPTGDVVKYLRGYIEPDIKNPTVLIRGGNKRNATYTLSADVMEPTDLMRSALNEGLLFSEKNGFEGMPYHDHLNPNQLAHLANKELGPKASRLHYRNFDTLATVLSLPRLEIQLPAFSEFCRRIKMPYPSTFIDFAYLQLYYAIRLTSARRNELKHKNIKPIDSGELLPYDEIDPDVIVRLTRQLFAIKEKVS